MEAKGPGGEATFYYQKFPCGGMMNPFQLEIHDLVATTASVTTPSNESGSIIDNIFTNETFFYLLGHILLIIYRFLHFTIAHYCTSVFKYAQGSSNGLC